MDINGYLSRDIMMGYPSSRLKYGASTKEYHS
jgi:hypothetical protein